MICSKILESPVESFTCNRCKVQLLERDICNRCGKPYAFHEQTCIYCNEEPLRLLRVRALFPYKDLYKDVKPGTTILIDDGKIEIEVDRIEGKNVVIIGRSNIVGKPLAQCLLNKDATVTVCHSKTQNLEEITRQADILLVAIGKPEFVTAKMVKEGATVIDIGINRNEEGKLVGDVKFDEVSQKVQYISPVPGGVGPMTIAMLLNNVIKAAKQQNIGG